MGHVVHESSQMTHSQLWYGKTMQELRHILKRNMVYGKTMSYPIRRLKRLRYLVCRINGVQVRTMQYAGWPVGGSVPCPGCVQAQLLINVLRQGMHPVCVDAGPLMLPQYQHTTHPLQVFTASGAVRPLSQTL